MKLIDFIKGVVKETEGQMRDEEPVHIYTGLPSNPVGLEMRAQDVQKLLKDGAVLGIFGVGGIGKTSLAREVFNNISKDFQYTCFVDNVKDFSIKELRNSVVVENFYSNGIKLDKAKTQWSQMKGKKSLIVMDDSNSEDQLNLRELQHFGNGSCFIITSRDKEGFKYYENHIVYDIGFLQRDEATKLFCKHAFGSGDVPDHLNENVGEVVAKCGGLPLTLEVMGLQLRGKKLDTQWEQTLDNLWRLTKEQGPSEEVEMKMIECGLH